MVLSADQERTQQNMLVKSVPRLESVNRADLFTLWMDVGAQQLEWIFVMMVLSADQERTQQNMLVKSAPYSPAMFQQSARLERACRFNIQTTVFGKLVQFIARELTQEDGIHLDLS